MNPKPSDAELLMALRTVIAPIKAVVAKQPGGKPLPEHTDALRLAAQPIYDTLRHRYDTRTAIGLMREVWLEREELR